MATLAELSILLTAKDQASGTFQTVEKNAGGMGSAIGGIAKTVATVGAIGAVALGGLAVKSVMAASDMAEAQNKVNVVFGEGAEAINAFASTAARSVGLSRTEALNATGTFGNMFTQLGIGEAASADMSTQMVKLAADFGSFHNADISDVIAAQTSAFRGEYDAVQRFVPTINAANVEQKALEMTGKATTKMLTAQEKALAVQTLLMEGAGKATGDFANTSTGMANSMRIIKASISDATVQIGERLLPVVTPMIAAFAQAIPGAIDAAIGVFDRLGQVISPLIAAGQGLFDIFVNRDFTGGIFGLQEDSPVIGFLFQFRDAIFSIGGYITGLISTGFDPLNDALSEMPAFLQPVAMLFGTFASAISEAAEAFSEGGLGGAIQAFIERIVLMAPFIAESILQLAQSLGDAILNALPGIIAAFLEWASAAVEWAADILPPLLTRLLELASGVLAWALEAGGRFMTFLIDTWLPAFLQWAIDMAPVLLELLTNLASQVIAWIGANAPTIATKLIEWAFAFTGWVLFEALPRLIPALFKLLVALIDWILTDALPAILSAAFQMGLAIVQGIVDGVGGLFGKLKDKLIEAFKAAFRSVLDFLGISSPSKKFMWVGEQMAAGLAQGFGSPTFGIGVPALSAAGAGAGFAAMGGPQVNVYVQGSVITEQDLIETVRRGLIATATRNGNAI